MRERFERFLCSSLARDVAFVLLLGVFIYAAYAPSLRHAPRADQWCFLVDTYGHDDFLEVLAHSYSYNRTRVTCPGDTDLFRPVLFGVLAAEKAWLGGNLAAVQAVGLVLHLLNCVLLLTILKQLTRMGDRLAGDPPGNPARGLGDYLPHALTAFFALSPAIMELVIWAHLHGYLLFLALILGSVSLLLRHTANPATVGSLRSQALWCTWLLTFVSAFTYEMGQFFAVLAGVFVAGVALPRIGYFRATVIFVAFASIMPVYQAVNAHDRTMHEGRYEPERVTSEMREQMFTLATVEHSGRFAVYSTVQPFCPTYLWTSSSGGRVHVAEALWYGPWRPGFGPALIVSGFVLSVGAVLVLVGLTRLGFRGERTSLFALLFLASLFALYSAITVLGRMNLRPSTLILSSNSYYTYPALLFAMCAGYAAVSALGRTRPWVQAARGCLVLGLLPLTLLGAEQVRRVNAEVAYMYGPFATPLRALDRFVDAHQHEPGFSFSVNLAASDPIPVVGGKPITTVVFGKWMNTPTPRYRVAIRGIRVVVLAGPTNHGS